MLRRCLILLLVCCCVFAVCGRSDGADWPTYRGDNHRSGVSAEKLSLPLNEAWSHSAGHRPVPAWAPPAENSVVMKIYGLSPTVAYDRAYDVVVAGDAMYYGSSADDSVYCVDAATGQTRWSFTTEGPVRLAPTVADGKLYVGSDDGYVYCLNAKDGVLLWKYRAGPDDRRLPGNGRMISLWPIRSGVVVDKGTVYFCAGLFPDQGVYFHAINAETQAEIWKQQIGRSSQGHLVVSPSRLYLPTGRSAPGMFDRQTGKGLGGFGKRQFEYGNMNGGCFGVMLGDMYVHGVNERGRMQISDPETRESLVFVKGLRLVARGSMIYVLDKDKVTAVDRVKYSKLPRQLKALRAKKDQTEADKAQIAKLEEKRKKPAKWEAECADGRSMVLAGGALFVGGDNEVRAYSVVDGSKLWTGKVDGKAYGLAVSGGRLFVSTDAGKIHCFSSGGQTVGALVVEKSFEEGSAYPADELTAMYAEAAQKMVDAAGVKKGYCLVLGAGEGRLAYEIAKRSEFRVIGVEADAAKVEAGRRKLSKAGFYGSRVVLHKGGGEKLPYQKYFANLIVSEETLRTGKLPASASEVYRVLRPCGGTVSFGSAAGTFDGNAVKAWGGASGLSGWNVQGGQQVVMINVRRGRLEGAGEWSHYYADSGNTACSKDSLPFGRMDIQWFGRPGPRNMVDRHHKSIAPLYKNGRLFVSGLNYIYGVDAYNGTVLWGREASDSARLASLVDCGNMVAGDELLYVASGSSCLVHDAQTGEVRASFDIADGPGGEKREWGYIAKVDDILFGSATKPNAHYRKHAIETARFRARRDFKPMICSDSVFARDSETGKELWEYTPKNGVIINPTVTVGGGLIYFVESLNPETREVPDGRIKLEMLLAKGANLVALDTSTGEERWRVAPELAFEHIIYLSWANDILLLSGSKHVTTKGEDGNEKKVMRFDFHAFNSKSGDVRWQFESSWSGGAGSGYGNQDNHPAIVGDKFYTQHCAYSLDTGKELEGWKWDRNGHGCSGEATSAFCNFHRGGTPVMQKLSDGSLLHLTAVVRSGCWMNIIPAGGLVLMPDASSGCTCSFSVQTSMAFVPRQE